MMQLTLHARQRIAQRGLTPHDIELLQLLGADVKDGLLACQKDFQELEVYLRRLVKRLQRLRGKRVVEREGKIVTAYHASKRKQKRLQWKE